MIKTKLYLHSSKESMWDEGEELGLTEQQLDNFKYALYTVEFEVEVLEDGNVKILKVNGMELVDAK